MSHSTVSARTRGPRGQPRRFPTDRTKSSADSHCPAQFFLAPIWLLMISAMSVGSAISDVPIHGDAGETSEESAGEPQATQERETPERTGVDRGARVVEVEGLAAKVDLLELDLPVPPPADGDVVNPALVVLVVDATKDGLALLRVAAHPERKDGLVEEALVDHVVERRDDVLHRDRVVPETEDAVYEGQASVSAAAHEAKCREPRADSPNLPKANVKPGSTVDSAKS